MKTCIIVKINSGCQIKHKNKILNESRYLAQGQTKKPTKTKQTKRKSTMLSKETEEL